MTYQMGYELFVFVQFPPMNFILMNNLISLYYLDLMVRLFPLDQSRFFTHTHTHTHSNNNNSFIVGAVIVIVPI